MANNQDQKALQDALNRVYQTLKFTADDIRVSINSLSAIQQVAVASELMKLLTKDEIKILNEAVEKSDEEKKTVMEQIAQTHAKEEVFRAAAQTAVKKALNDHIAYLKTRGDDAQKAEIARILAEIG